MQRGARPNRRHPSSWTSTRRVADSPSRRAAGPEAAVTAVLPRCWASGERHEMIRTRQDIARAVRIYRAIFWLILSNHIHSYAAMADARHDDLFLALAKQHDGIQPLLRSFFSFLHRRTDFYVVDPSDDRPMGFAPGQAERLVRATRECAGDRATCVFCLSGGDTSAQPVSLPPSSRPRRTRRSWQHSGRSPSRAPPACRWRRSPQGGHRPQGPPRLPPQRPVRPSPHGRLGAAPAQNPAP